MVRFRLSALWIAASLAWSTTITPPADATAADSLRVYHLDPIDIRGERVDIATRALPVQKDYPDQILRQHGFEIISRGNPLAGDLYGEGFKRGDLTAVIDGEHYPNACPNRMDPPATRVNPLELESIELVKTSTRPTGGLAGAVEYHRRAAQDPFAIRGGITGTGGAARSADLAFSIDGRHLRLTGRESGGEPYEDGDGRDFTQLYNFAQLASYRLHEYALHGAIESWQYGLSYSDATDFSFPYLRMDERTNVLWSGFVNYRGNKLYANHTDHTMDNGLRTGMMSMVTATRNLTVGLNGERYNAYYRRWTADNTIQSSTMHIDNAAIPDLREVQATASHAWQPARSLHVAGKLGISHVRIDDTERLGFYQPLYPGASSSRWFVPFAVNLTHARELSSRAALGLLGEVAGEPPDPEFLYIAINRPMSNPDWVGNPELAAPLRATVRGQVTLDAHRWEIYGTHVWDYVQMSRGAAAGQAYMTYENVRGLLLGFNLRGTWRFVDYDAAYTWGDNRTHGTPFAEIAPFRFQTTLRAPTVYGIDAALGYVYAARQDRIDPALDEETTPDWMRLDLRFGVGWQTLRFMLEIDNLTNEVYHQHLSYQRNPYASGFKVYEPGRTLRLAVSLDQPLESRP